MFQHIFFPLQAQHSPSSTGQPQKGARPGNNAGRDRKTQQARPRHTSPNPKDRAQAVRNIAPSTAPGGHVALEEIAALHADDARGDVLRDESHLRAERTEAVTSGRFQ